MDTEPQKQKANCKVIHGLSAVWKVSTLTPPSCSGVNCAFLQKGTCFAEKVLRIKFPPLSIFLSLFALKIVDWFLSVIQLSKTTSQ